MVENVLVTFDDFPLTAVIHVYMKYEISNTSTIMLKSHTNVFDRVFWVLVYWLFLSVFSDFLILWFIVKTSFFTVKEKRSIKIDDTDMADI